MGTRTLTGDVDRMEPMGVPMFDLHQDRRTAGVPTLSLIIGELEAGLDALNTTAAARNLRTRTIHLTSITRLDHEIAATLGVLPEVRDIAIDRLSQATHTGREQVLQFADSHSQDAQLFFRRAMETGRNAELACSLLGRSPCDTPLSAEQVLTLIGRGGGAPWMLVVLVSEASNSVVAQIRSLCRLLSTAPRTACAAIMAAPVYRTLQRQPEERWTTMLQEGAWELPVPTLQQASLLNKTSSSIVAQSRRRYCNLSKSGSQQAARSAFEQYAFDLLEQHPLTTGLFELNGKLGFRFGHRRAEVDLLCRRYGIAVEIDGHFHFAGGKAAWRTDRRKDLLLQTHQYLVTRWLAEDVVERPREFLNTVRKLVQARRTNAVGGAHT